MHLYRKTVTMGEKMYSYISNQDTVLKNLENDVKAHLKMSLIDGLSGSGKTYVLENIGKKFADSKICWLKGDRYAINRDYYPFLNFINQQYMDNPDCMNKKRRTQQITDVIEHAGSLAPIGDEMISVAIEKIVNNKKEKKELTNCIFSLEELQILFQIEYFCDDNKFNIFLCDDAQYWDEKSIQLLYVLLKHSDNNISFIDNSFFAVSVTGFKKNKLTEGLYALAEENIYTLVRVQKENYLTVLKQLGLQISLNSTLADALYSITSGNLQLSHDIVMLLNENQYSAEEAVANIVEEKKLGHMLIERLGNTDTGNQINETLKYASLFGNTFQYYELETILNKNEGDIRKVLQEAENYALVKKTSASASFVHEIICNAYKKEILIEKEKYYSQYSACIKVLYPGDYRLRKESLYLAGEIDYAHEMEIIEYLQLLRGNQIPIHINISALEISPLLNEYISVMKDAYYAFNAGQYSDCMGILDTIEDIYKPTFQAEKYYLLSITLSKWLDSASRKKARECLTLFLDKGYIDNETELWERIVSAYIVACIHDNQRKEAEIYEQKLSASISSRLNYDFDALCKLNILRRKASMIYDEKKTFQLTQKSKNFFSMNLGKILDPLQYYMAAANFIAAALKMGKCSVLSEDIIKLLDLPSLYPYINFQRMEIPLNNIIIASYINQELSADTAIKKLENILETYKSEETTSTIIESNIAVLYCIDGDLNTGKTILEKIYNKFQIMDNLEFYYKYLITRNLSAVKYLFDKKEAVDLLESLAALPNLGFRKVFKMQTEALLKNMKETINDVGADWYYESLNYPYNEAVPSFWNYYGKKYLFGELEFWSES